MGGRGKRVVLVALPELNNVDGAGGLSVRWGMYIAELRAAGWPVEIWKVGDPFDRLHIPFAQQTLLDQPTLASTLAISERLRLGGVQAVISTELTHSLYLALVCRLYGVPYIFSNHTDIIKLHSACTHTALTWATPVLMSPGQMMLVGLAHCSVTTSASFMQQQRRRCIRIGHFYKPLQVQDLCEAAREVAPQERVIMRQKMLQGYVDTSSTFLMCYSGRWSPEKRIELLIAAMIRLADSDVVLCIQGNGSDAYCLKIQDAAASARKQGARVVCLREMLPRQELPKLYLAADCMVSASNFETFGNTPYEAASACGTPSILQRAQGFTDQIAGGLTGVLVDFGTPRAGGCGAEVQQAVAAIRSGGCFDRKAVQEAAKNTAALPGTTICELVDKVVGEHTSCGAECDGWMWHVAKLVVALYARSLVALFEIFLLVASSEHGLLKRLRSCCAIFLALACHHSTALLACFAVSVVARRCSASKAVAAQRGRGTAFKSWW